MNVAPARDLPPWGEAPARRGKGADARGVGAFEPPPSRRHAPGHLSRGGRIFATDAASMRLAA